MKISVLTNKDNIIESYGVVLKEGINPLSCGKIIETDIDCSMLDICYKYKLENEKMIELTDEEKEKLFPKVEPVVEPSLADQIKALKQDNENLQACILELASLMGGTK